MTTRLMENSNVQSQSRRELLNVDAFQNRLRFVPINDSSMFEQSKSKSGTIQCSGLPDQSGVGFFRAMQFQDQASCDLCS